MADGYDRFEHEGGGSFVMGLLTGTVLGAGLGMLFAPKSGSELRGQLSEQAGKVASTASEGYRRATEKANDLADKGREYYGKAADKGQEFVDKAADKGQEFVDKAADKGQQYVDKAREAVGRGADEVKSYASSSTRNSRS